MLGPQNFTGLKPAQFKAHKIYGAPKISQLDRKTAFSFFKSLRSSWKVPIQSTVCIDEFIRVNLCESAYEVMRRTSEVMRRTSEVMRRTRGVALKGFTQRVKDSIIAANSTIKHLVILLLHGIINTCTAMTLLYSYVQSGPLLMRVFH